MVPSPGCRLLVLSVLLLTAGHTNGSINTNHRQFADDLTTALSLYTSGSNQCISTWGISMALSLVYPGCDEECAQNMQMVLRYPLPTYAYEWRDGLVWEDTASRLDAANDGRCESQNVRVCRKELPTIEIANGIWLDEGSRLADKYNTTVGDYAKQIDFYSEDAGGEVNAWVEENTNGLIDEIVGDGPLLGKLLIAINSIYLKASWAIPFAARLVTEDKFYLGPSRAVAIRSNAHFMHAIGARKYSHIAIPGYQILRLPFIGDSLSMVIVLPSTEDSAYVNSSDVLEAIPQLTEVQSIAMAIPKFKFKSTYADDLESALQSLGMTAPFGSTLCFLFQGGCGFIDEIIQKTAIDVNEEGVEAAAVTMVGVGYSAPAPVPASIEFMANHPFQFFIHDEVEDIILFQGLVVEPGISDDSEAQLEAQHSEVDFWQTHFGIPALVPGRGPSMPRLIGRPVVVSRTTRSVVIRFQTSMSAKVKVIYSKRRRIPRRRRKSSNFVITQVADGYMAAITLTGLEANTRYYYRLIISDGIQVRRRRRWFITLPS